MTNPSDLKQNSPLSDPTDTPEDDSGSKNSLKFKLYVALVIIAIIFLNTYPPAKEYLVETTKSMASLGWYGSVLATLFCGLILIPLALPYYFVESTLAFNTQDFWQPFCIGVAAKIIGCSLCFMVARMWMSNWIIRKFKGNQIFRGILIMLERQPWKFSFIFRIIMLPYFLKNYGLAIPKNVTFLMYMLPAVLSGAILTGMNVHMTQTVRDLSGYGEDVNQQANPVSIVFSVVGIGLMIYVGKYTYGIVQDIRREESKSKGTKVEKVE